jgi:hypothetical protein
LPHPRRGGGSTGFASGLADETPLAGNALDEPHEFQDTKSLAQRTPADAEFLHELSFRRQRISQTEFTVGDELLEFVHDLFVDSGLFDAFIHVCRRLLRLDHPVHFIYQAALLRKGSQIIFQF